MRLAGTATLGCKLTETKKCYAVRRHTLDPLSNLPFFSTFINVAHLIPFDPICPFVDDLPLDNCGFTLCVLDLPLRELRTKMRRCLPALRTTRATGCPKEERAAARAQVGESGVGTRCLDDALRQDVSGGQEMSRFREASQNYRTVQVGE